MWLLSNATFVPGEERVETPQVLHGGGGHLVSIGMTLVVVGLGLMLRTEDVVRFVLQRMFGRVVRDGDMRRLKVRYRIYGGVCIAVGLLQLKSWLERYG